MTSEERRNLPKKRAKREEVDTFYLVAASLSALVTAQEQLEARTRLIPGGWRDLRMLVSRLQNLMLCLLSTFEPEKQQSIRRQMKHIRLKTVFAPEASKEPDMLMIQIEDLGVLLHAASQECKLHMCPSGDCAQCQLGKVLGRTSYVSRGDRAWWEIFEQASRTDAGEEDAG